MAFSCDQKNDPNFSFAGLNSLQSATPILRLDVQGFRDGEVVQASVLHDRFVRETPYFRCHSALSLFRL